MGWSKVKDLAVGVRKYTKDGEEKTEWANVGEILDDGNGKRIILLNRHFNPAGIPFQEGKSKIAISEFDPREKEDRAPAQRQQQAPKAASGSDIPDDVPF